MAKSHFNNAPKKSNSANRNRANKNQKRGITMVVSIKKIEVTCGLWITGCIAAAGFLFSFHYLFSAVALFACAVISGIYAVGLVWFHKPRTKLGLVPALVASAGNAFCLGLLAFGFRDLLQPQVSRFGFTRTTTLLSTLDRAHATPWRFLWNGTPPSTVPVQLIMGMIIENEQPIPTTIVAYGLSWAKSPSGPWQALCPVSSVGAQLYWVSDPSQAVEMGAEDFADRKLIGRRLMPFDPVQFKTAWECPNECSAEYTRFSVTEANGRESAVILRADSAPQKEMGAGESMQVFGPDHKMDLSQAAVAFDPNCNP